MKKRPHKQVECLIPVLPVRNLASSLRFYTAKLGFKLDWSGGGLGSVSRDGHAIMLRQEPRGKKAAKVCVWIGLHDDRLFKTYKKRGVKILQEPCNRPWAYEMIFADPDGHVLWLGTEPKRNLPIAAGS
jgi:predicted lactoylglutathione lyase